jgi:hypothetical protein
VVAVVLMSETIRKYNQEEVELVVVEMVVEVVVQVKPDVDLKVKTLQYILVVVAVEMLVSQYLQVMVVLEL